MAPISILDSLYLQNPWWQKPQGLKNKLGKPRKKYLKMLENYIPLRQMLLLYGLRRTGKTTLLFQIMNKLLKNGVESQKILYFSFDELKVHPFEILKTYTLNVLNKSLVDLQVDNMQIYIFFDEIQKLPDWQNKIKVIYDQFPSFKIFLSGSASTKLQKQSRESLAGRLFEFHIKPLDFKEFLQWQPEKIDIIHTSQDKIELLLNTYFLTGGFPEAVKLAQEGNDSFTIKEYIRHTVLDNIISKDLPEIFGLRDIDLLTNLLQYFTKNPGLIANFDHLASDFGRSKNTIINYLYYLEYGLVLKRVRNFRIKPRLASRKNFKVYPTSTAFYLAYLPQQREELSKTLEVAVLQATNANYYYHNSFEVDFIITNGIVDKIVPIEVKSGKANTHQIQKFIQRYQSKVKLPGYIVTYDKNFTQNTEIKTLSIDKFLLKTATKSLL